MDHTHIEERGLIDLYHRGQIPPSEEAEFEEHFVGCRQCQDRLEAARGFQRGLKTVVAEDAARTVVQAGLLAWALRRRGLVVALLALIAVLPAVGFFAGEREAREAYATWKDLWEGERKTASELERRLAESERRHQEERRNLERQIAEARPTDAPPIVPAPPSPLVNTPLLLLTAVRGEADVPVLRAGADGYVSLAVDAGNDSRFDGFRATITDAAGQRVFRRDGLKPNALEAILLTFPVSFFQAGEHTLVLEGLRPGGSGEAGDTGELGAYPFRVARKASPTP